MMTAPSSNVTAAGLKPATFARACSISRTALYQLPKELKPRSVRFGRAVVIVEPPSEWLARIAEIQQKSAPNGSDPVEQQNVDEKRRQARPRAAVVA